MRADDLGFNIDAAGGLERTLMLRPAPLARVYAWGPKGGDWDQLGRWEVRWQWPWGGWLDVRASSPGTAPWSSIEAAGRALGAGPGSAPLWAIIEGDDPDHALLFARHGTGATVEVFVLEAGRSPMPARRSSGDAFPDIEGAARVGGRWFIATMQSPGELAATVVWAFDGGAVARELIRFPRSGFEARPTLRLARHTDGRTIGLVVDGQPDELRGTASRWVVGVDMESGSSGTPEPLAPADLSDRGVTPCTGDDFGWEVELPYPGAVGLRIGSDWESSLQGPVARMRLSRDRACVERVLGTLSLGDAPPPEALTEWSYAPTGRARESVRTVDASVVAVRTRYALRCSVR